MEPLRFNYKKSVISYYRFGSGPRPAICFHGYGEDASIFEFLVKYAGNQFTFYCLDLPFHGKTEWSDELVFTTKDLLAIMEEVVGEGNQKSKIKSQKFSILGFSLG